MEIPITSEREMEALIASETAEIQVESLIYRAAVCPRCGTKFYPAESLEAHMDRHQLRDLFLEGELKKLQLAMGKMR
ncbi:MAG: C2H2-type zinc finger protein [Candidatus Binatia bacterium]